MGVGSLGWRFRIGDEVRIAISKRHFEKGYTPNWTEEVFIVHEILPTAPITSHTRSHERTYSRQFLRSAIAKSTPN